MLNCVYAFQTRAIFSTGVISSTRAKLVLFFVNLNPFLMENEAGFREAM